MRANVTNTAIAEKLGNQHTTVSRWRSGSRVPGLSTMLLIAEEYGWTLQLQALSAKAGMWHEGFEAALAMKHGSEEQAANDSATTP